MIVDDRGGRMFVCSDTDFCETRREQGHSGPELQTAPDAIRGGAKP